MIRKDPGRFLIFAGTFWLCPDLIASAPLASNLGPTLDRERILDLTLFPTGWLQPCPILSMPSSPYGATIVCEYPRARPRSPHPHLLGLTRASSHKRLAGGHKIVGIRWVSKAQLRRVLHSRPRRVLGLSGADFQARHKNDNLGTNSLEGKSGPIELATLCGFTGERRSGKSNSKGSR
jgi:hypothetical protein